MQISNDRYFLDREKHDLALRMIHHEARTCTIRACTGLSDDRIRGLYRTYANHNAASPVRRRRGKSPGQSLYFVRNLRAQYESSLLASTFACLGLLRSDTHGAFASLSFGRLFCAAYETHQQLTPKTSISFEHAWFLLRLLIRCESLSAVRCRRCDSLYLRHATHPTQRTCPLCRLKGSSDADDGERIDTDAEDADDAGASSVRYTAAHAASNPPVGRAVPRAVGAAAQEPYPHR